MKQRIKLILVLMSVCTLCLLSFQFYWSYQGYLSASKTFKADINQALQAAVDRDMELRQDYIADKYKAWLADTNLVNIDCHVDTVSGTTVFTVTDKKESDNEEATFTIGFQEYRPETGKMTAKVKQYFINRFVNTHVRENLQEKVAIYYTRQLGDLLEEAYKQMQLDKARLQQFYKEELLARDIKTSHRLYFADEALAETEVYPYATRTFEFGFRRPFYEVTAYFPDPNKTLMLRMKWVLLSSLVLAAVTICCFAYTVLTILRQKKLAELKNDFVNNMTHELRTPVATISIAAEAMQDFNLSKNSSAEYLSIIRQQSGRLSHLIDGILKNLAFEQNQLELLPRPVSVQQLVQQAILQHRPQLDIAGASINFDQPAQVILVNADELHLLNVLSNLIENALKYSRGTLRLHISCHAENGKAILSITDNGIGIPTAMQQKVFDKFFRVPSGNVHNTKGYGLGLSYAKTIIERHSGSISLQSKENQGTTFTIALPLYTYETAERTPA
ncbi:HAMP domain-containing sensor histidine kinase [uncultured Pontibacter sp.]|uniref:sensor histidine kinase n=1 Tax=uncultured Pontibacter sp. TaxID=453356 RepID=UPI0026076BE6|nr:HAMP domain-containing sensor histidine kinase [uncultured Pontibacter sp.]